MQKKLDLYPCYGTIFHNLEAIFADKQELKSGKVTSFFRSQLTGEKRSLFQDLT